MITPEQLKYYLKLNDTDLGEQEIRDRDEFLRSCIEQGRSELDSILNRKLQKDSYTETIRKNISRSEIYLKNAPIISVESLKYWSGDVYTDFYETPETINDNVELCEYYFLIRSGNALYKDFKVEYTAGYTFEPLTGTISGSIGSKEITGTGTAFDTEVAVGDEIIIAGERRKVASIAGAGALTLDLNLSRAYSNVAVYLNTYPADLAKTCLQLSAFIFLDSRQGEGALNKLSDNMSLGGSAGNTFKKLDLTHIKTKYEIINL